MRHRSFDLKLAVFICLISCVLAFAGFENNFVRLVLALPLVFFLPGYVVLEAVFPVGTLSVLERLLYCLGMSLIIGILGGITLNALPWGLQSKSWAILLSIVILGGSIIAWRRRASNLVIAKPRVGINVRQAFILIFAIFGVVGAYAIASKGAAQPRDFRFTQLWLLSENKTGVNMLHLGVKNMEGVVVDYAIQLVLDDRLVKVWEPFSLQPGEVWDTTWTMQAESEDVKVIEALLYRLDDPDTVYRKVALWR